MKKFVLALLAVAFTASAAQAQIVSSKNSRITVEKQKKVRGDYENYNRLSFGLSTYKLKSDKKLFEFTDDGKASESLKLKGIDINYLRGINVTGQKLPLYVEVGGRLTYDTHKEKIEDSEAGVYEGSIKSRYNLLSLSVPVNVTYKYTFSNGFYLAPFVGIHFRLNLLCQEKVDEKITYKGEYRNYADDIDESTKISYFKADDDDDEAFFGTGDDTFKRFQFGGQVGLNIGYNKLNLGIGYYFDSPIYKYEDDESSKYDFKIKSGGVALTLGYNF